MILKNTVQNAIIFPTEQAECLNIKTQAELYDIQVCDECPKTTKELIDLLNRGIKYDYIYLSAHGGEDGALANGIPGIAGVDAYNSVTNPNIDNITDHFIVLVETGNDSNGNFIRFVDNSTSRLSAATSSENKLYDHATTGVISGRSQTAYGNDPSGHAYRKSIHK
ncbi:hypothetical protein [Mucilaginibacter gossypii]|uniref:Uncharacterized protein n=1 Tax=Mucilaginibacter gossypii TaxID=551996 RepID=A0A1G8AJB2_9SPHI|nr:hypothetical protein [Mucilaginibacter gossypii]SDH20979.1 hypothetical protein SAMN05192573_107216 [Mucilaginibacter gossypii]